MRPFILPASHALLTGVMLLLFAACAEEPAEDVAEPIDESIGAAEDVADADYFSDWDFDNDDILTLGEFRGGFGPDTGWEEYDLDNNDRLSPEEFGEAFSTYGWYEPGLYEEWDANDDDLLTEEEFETGLYDTLDANDDELLMREEFDENEGVFV